MERGELDGAGGLQPGDVGRGIFSRPCALGHKDYRDGHLAACGGLCAERSISAARSEPWTARADAAEVYGARGRRVGGYSVDSIHVRVPVCESLHADAAATGVRPGDVEKCAALFSSA